MARAVPPANVDDLVNYVFLPSKLPQSAAAIPIDSDLRLLESTSAALKDFARGLPTAAHNTAVDRLAEAFISARRVYGSADYISADNLRKSLKALADSDSVSNRIPLHICAQNAGLVISRASELVTFQTFELSPKNKDVMSTAGRLNRIFPGCAISIDTNTFSKLDFLTTLANALAKMSIQAVPGTQPQSKKKGQKEDEERDTTNPGIITELLFAGFLRSMGTVPTATTILKHTRDDVLWENAKGPWRRSPMWLLIRVTMQLTLSQEGPDGNAIYKECIVFIHSVILKHYLARSSTSSDMLSCMNANIVRRLQKLSSQPTELLHARRGIQDTLGASHRALMQHMDASQGTKNLTLSGLSSLDFNKDTFISLPQVNEYIL
ncbi:unnamed protein product [Zymoseptoria tritici ST99CH_3D7]|uniref:DUF6606 domain-containing protein n=1 Tax=Zymoseptoria tritici (strain ST99CH_3D7) TaxID=1276538 RepID=A0A1X7RXJ3_ZYMT9|nr:unnamed protein product [Zymoseptoria tritici ST99CH_3D7]